MQTSSVPAGTPTLPVSAAQSSTSTGAGRDLNALRSEDFFRLLVTELRQQDPFEPAKTADMIGQVSQIRSIELSKQLTDTLTQLTRQQHTAGASDLLGKYVTATVTAADGTPTEVEGVVTGVRFDRDGAAVLELDTGQAVRAADVTHITTVQPTGAKGNEATGQQGNEATGQQGNEATRQEGNEATRQQGKEAEASQRQRAGFVPRFSLDGLFQK